MAKRAHCSWCGKDIGDAPFGPPAPESCGESECNREVRYQRQEQDAEARFQAEEDGFSLYGGLGGW